MNIEEFKNKFRDVYDELMEKENSYDDEEEETFIDSKEIVKMKHPPEKINGAIKLDPIDDEKDMEEVFHYKRYSKVREHHYTEQELESIKESCKLTLVNDFSLNDEYHLSDEERLKNDNLKELSLKLVKLKTIYRQVDKYVEAMRVVMEAWKILEEKENILFTEKEFYKMIKEGKISHPRIPLPRLKNADKYNMDLIITYISNPELSVQDLLGITQSKYDPWNNYAEDDNDESDEERMNRLLSDDEIQAVIDKADDPPSFEVSRMKDKYIKGYKKTIFTSKKKNKKKTNKLQKRITKDVHALLNKIQMDPNNFRGSGLDRSYLATSTIFGTQKKKRLFLDNMKFNGSWANKYDVEMYNILERLELADQPSPSQRFSTYGAEELDRFFKVMEAAGFNTIELRQKMSATQTLQDEISKNKRKDNRKIEARIIDRITKLNNNAKFKKLVSKAEDALANYNEENEDEDDD